MIYLLNNFLVHLLDLCRMLHLPENNLNITGKNQIIISEKLVIKMSLIYLVGI